MVACGHVWLCVGSPDCSSAIAHMFAFQDLFSKSDTFLEIYRINEDGSEQLVHRTEVSGLGSSVTCFLCCFFTVMIPKLSHLTHSAVDLPCSMNTLKGPHMGSKPRSVSWVQLGLRFLLLAPPFRRWLRITWTLCGMPLKCPLAPCAAVTRTDSWRWATRPDSLGLKQPCSQKHFQ